MVKVIPDYRGGFNLLMDRASSSERAELLNRIELLDDVRYVVHRDDYIKVIPKRGVSAIELIAEIIY